MVVSAEGEFYTEDFMVWMLGLKFRQTNSSYPQVRLQS